MRKTTQTIKAGEIIEEISRINSLLPIYKKIGKAYLSPEPLPLANGIKVRRQKVKELIEKGGARFEEIDIRSGVVRRDSGGIKPVQTEDADYDQTEFSNIAQSVREIFAEILSIDVNSIRDKDHFIDDLGGDSLSSLGVFSKAEEMYHVIIPDTEYFTCANVEDLSKLLYQKIHGIEAGEISKAKTGVSKIVRFEQSSEYKELEKQAADAAGDMPDNKDVISFGSYDYLRMSGDPDVIAAAKQAIDRLAVSSDPDMGRKPILRELEKAVAEWKHTEDSLVATDAYVANAVLITSFCNQRDLILYDELSNQFLAWGCLRFRSDMKAFPHNDASRLEHMLQTANEKYEKILIIADGIYPADGSIAPIPDFVALKKRYGAFLMVDESDANGVIGKTGGGVEEYYGLVPGDIDIKTGTLSKALGVFGGYIAGEEKLIQYLRCKMLEIVSSPVIGPPAAAAVLEAVKLIQKGNPKVALLQDHIAYFIEMAKQKGFDTCLAKEAAIVPIMVYGEQNAHVLSRQMRDYGIYVPAVTYPQVSEGQARLRFCLTSGHAKEQMDFALDTLKKLMDDLGIKK